MTPLLKNLLIALALAVVLWLGYQFFLSQDDVVLESEGDLATTEASRNTQEFLLRLQQLRDLEFDQSLFTDGRFRSLVDHRQDIIEEPVGRPNPFVSANP